MKVSLEWLKDWVLIRLPVEKLAERLTMGGLEVISTEKKGNDTILGIEVTPNRPDLLSHVGVAREIAALTGAQLKQPAASRLPFPSQGERRKGPFLPLEISIQDKKGCLRYIGRLFDQVTVGPSPSWLKARLERLGLRSVNNVVDLTNYVLLEEGQPLHAFDYDRIEGGKVIIRSAKEGETLLTIDGDRHALKKGELVIADTQKPIALAGIIGGKESEIGPNTKRVLLESAYFDPVTVRRASRRLGLSTESSYRFERGVSLEGVASGSDSASRLLLRWAGAKGVRSLDLGKKSFPRKTIALSLQDLHDTLGVSPTLSQSRTFLSRLGCRVTVRNRSLLVTPPSFRRDLQEGADLSEEIGRLLGYDRIPVTAPLRERISLARDDRPVDLARSVEKQVKDLLVSQGLFEVVTYSLLSRSLLKTFFGETKSFIPLRNPMSLEQELMRPSLIPRLVEVASYNHHRKAEGIPIFEVGPVYEKEGTHYLEKKKLGILLSGKRSEDWRGEESSYDYFDLKGKCEALIKTLNASFDLAYRAKEAPFLVSNGVSMACTIGEKEVGLLGELAPSIAASFDLKGKVVVAEIDLSALIPEASFSKKYISPPKHPSIQRDVALILGRNISSDSLVRTIWEKGGEWVRKVTLFDAYEDPRIISRGSQGLAYHIEFLHPERTLTDEEVNEKYQAILEALKQLGAKIR